jgi:hypothetical protein
MEIVVDTTVVIAVIANESQKARLIEMTRDAELVAPASLPWEIGNAFSAMFKQKRITKEQAILLRCLSIGGFPSGRWRFSWTTRSNYPHSSESMRMMLI